MTKEKVEVTFRSVDSRLSTRKAYGIAAVLRILQLLPLIFRLVFCLGMVAICYAITPIINGDVEMDNPLTNSQLTALVALIGLLVLWRMVRR